MAMRLFLSLLVLLLSMKCFSQTINVDLGPDREVCLGDTVNLVASITNGPADSIIWSTWDRNVDTLKLIVNDPHYHYKVFVYVYKGSQAHWDSVNIYIFSNMKISAGKDFTLCKDSDSIALTGIPAGGSWTGTGVSGSYFSPVNTGVGNHLVFYSMSSPAGCSISDTLIISVQTPVQFFAGNDTITCKNTNPIQLNGLPAGGTWIGPVYHGNYFSPWTNSIGKHMFIYTDSTKCAIPDTMFIQNFGESEVHAGPDTSLCYEDTIQLWATGASTYTWRNYYSPDTKYFDSTTVANPLYFLNARGNNPQSSYLEVKGVDSNGCISHASVSLLVDTTCVWPGDANDDGIANGLDVLAIGVAFGKHGSARNDTSTIWQSNFVKHWWTQFSNGVNHKHADCNGDSLVNYSDTGAISRNYLLTHNKRGGKLGGPGDPVLQVKMTADSVFAGEIITSEIHLGDATVEAEDIYGITYIITYPSELVEKGSLLVDMKNSWIANAIQPVILVKDYPELGEVHISLVRTDQLDVSGFGTIAVLSWTAAEPSQGNSGQFSLNVKDYTLIDLNFNEKELNIVSGSTQIVKKPSGITGVWNELKVSIVPNPADNHIALSFLGTEDEGTVSIYNLTGQQLFQRNLDSQKTLDIDISKLPGGVYMVIVRSENGSAIRKLVVR